MISYSFIVTGRNMAPWIEGCLTSILTQTHQPIVQVIVVDDDGNDDAAAMAIRLLSASCKTGWGVHRNAKHLGGLHNWYRTIHDEIVGDVVVLVAGDDRLEHVNVLGRVNEEYRKGAWVTFGQYRIHLGDDEGQVSVGHCRDYAPEIVREGRYRQASFTASHLVTFRTDLFQKISPVDLLDQEGRFFKMTGDVAIMIPMLEMARERAHFIPDILYVYNRDTPYNDDKIDVGLQTRTREEIFRRNPYQPVSNLPPLRGVLSST